MAQNKPMAGSESSVYTAAWDFFKKRELQGVKMPKKPKLSKEEENKYNVDISGIEIPREELDAVSIYDTCDDICRKISAHLKLPGVTQAQFLRDISAQFCTCIKKITAAQLQNFRNKSGPLEGNTSGVSYGSYVFFEKLRVAEGKPKSKRREEMENIWAHQGGLETDRLMNRISCPADGGWNVNSYGRIETFSRGGRVRA